MPFRVNIVEVRTSSALTVYIVAPPDNKQKSHKRQWNGVLQFLHAGVTARQWKMTDV